MSAIAATFVRAARGPRDVARFGIVLGALAFFLTLPPAETHARWVPVLIGLCAVACGVWAITRGVRKSTIEATISSTNESQIIRLRSPIASPKNVCAFSPGSLMFGTRGRLPGVPFSP